MIFWVNCIDFDKRETAVKGSVNRIPAIDEAVKLAQKQMLSIDTDRARFWSKQNRVGNFSAYIPYGLKQAAAEAKKEVAGRLRRI